MPLDMILLEQWEILGNIIEVGMSAKLEGRLFSPRHFVISIQAMFTSFKNFTSRDCKYNFGLQGTRLHVQ